MMKLLFGFKIAALVEDGGKVFWKDLIDVTSSGADTGSSGICS
jgi:hypothetical protein